MTDDMYTDMDTHRAATRLDAVQPDMTDEVVVVTGGTRGIGQAVAEHFAAAGATTIATYHADEDAAARTQERLAEYEGRSTTHRFDVGDPEAVATAFRDIKDAYGYPTVLVNNAGIMRNGSLIRMDESDWTEVLRTNLSGAFYCLQAAARGMLRTGGGSIINISSIAAHRGWPGQINYAASKAGLLGLTRAAARELGSRDITVNGVSPGYVRTSLYESAAASADYPDMDVIPQDRVSEPAEIADTVLYLASDGAAYVNGEIIRVDGGRLA